jgi:hypothetical protein
MSAQPTPKPPLRNPPRTGPPRTGPPANEKLGSRDVVAFVLAAFLHVLPYVAIAVGLFVLLLLVARLLG